MNDAVKTKFQEHGVGSFGFNKENAMELSIWKSDVDLP